MIDWLARGGPRDWLPDLALSPTTLTISAGPLTAGDTVTISGAVRNVGGALPADTATIVRLYDGPAAGGNVVGELPVGQLTADEAVPFTFTWKTAGSGGAHTLTAVVDPDGLVTEYTKENNVATPTVVLRAPVDLRVEPSGVSFPMSGGVAVRVQNLGYGAVAPGAARLALTDDAGQQLTTPIPAVPALASVTVVADPDHALPDPDAGNQTARVTLTPPAVTVYTPGDGSVLGGMKTFRWTFASDEFPAAAVRFAIGPVDGDLTPIYVAKVTSGRPQYAVDVDTTRYANGTYRVRVTADARLVRGEREVVFQIDNGAS